MQKPCVIIASAAHITQVRFLIYDLQSSLPQLFPNNSSLVAAGVTVKLGGFFFGGQQKNDNVWWAGPQDHNYLKKLKSGDEFVLNQS